MAKNNKDGLTPFERRLKIYEKYGIMPTLVRKTGAKVIFPRKHIVKGDKQ